MRTAGDAPVTIRRLSEPVDTFEELAADIMSGLTGHPKAIPSKYLYDGRGSELFEDITRLPEYYLTSAEIEILRGASDTIMALARPHEIVELGSGSSTKTRLLIDAMRRGDYGTKYLPIDISEDALRAAALDLCETYAWLEIEGLIGDFNSDLPDVPRSGRRLIVFLGSTIGNLDTLNQRLFLNALSSLLEPDDLLLLGMDLVKEPEALIAAYNDTLGITAEFTRNVLHVVNRELDADFPADTFGHVPIWNEEAARMEAWVESPKDMGVRVGALNLDVSLKAGERIHTEISCKFTPASIHRLFSGAGLRVVETFMDRDKRYALVLGAPGR